MRSYATVGGYYSWLGETPPDTGGMSLVLLKRASIIIDSILAGVVYPTDEDGFPTETKRIAAMLDATCAQALFTEETGDSTGAASTLGGASIGTLHLPGNSTATWTRAQQQARRQAPDAINILRTEGMMNRTVNDPNGTPYDLVAAVLL